MRSKDDHVGDERVERPTEVKSAKKLKVINASKHKLAETTASIAGSISSIEKAYNESRNEKKRMEEQKITLEEKKVNWQMTKEA